eukprot:UN21351
MAMNGAYVNHPGYCYSDSDGSYWVTDEDTNIFLLRRVT